MGRSFRTDYTCFQHQSELVQTFELLYISSLTLSSLRSLYRYIEIYICPFICSPNHWTGFYMITNSVMKDLMGFFWSFSKRKISKSNKQYNEPIVNNKYSLYIFLLLLYLWDNITNQAPQIKNCLVWHFFAILLTEIFSLYLFNHQALKG